MSTKFGKTCIDDSKEVYMCKNMDGHLDKQTDGQ